MSRSKMIYNILELLDEKVICMDDLDEFSDELKSLIKGLYLNN